MKTFTKACMLFLSLVITYNCKAQIKDARPQLFKGVENKITYPKTELEKIFTKTKGNKYKISLLVFT